MKIDWDSGGLFTYWKRNLCLRWGVRKYTICLSTIDSLGHRKEMNICAFKHTPNNPQNHTNNDPCHHLPLSYKSFPILGVVFLFGDSLFGADVSGSGYGAPAVGYGAPEGANKQLWRNFEENCEWSLNNTVIQHEKLWIFSAAYGAPAPSYSAPAPSYSAPAAGYDAANRYYVSCLMSWQYDDIEGEHDDKNVKDENMMVLLIENAWHWQSPHHAGHLRPTGGQWAGLRILLSCQRRPTLLEILENLPS